MVGPLSHVAAVAGAFHWDVAPPQPGFRERAITARVIRPSGSARLFHLIATPRGDYLAVREDPARSVLPAFCAERHINHDGTFCLFWRDYQDVRVVDRATAEIWIKLLLQFLQAQIYAERRREWPPGIQALPHGEAARHRIEAERIALQLGKNIHDDLMANRLKIEKTRLHRPGLGRSLRLLRSGRRIAAMWRNGEKIANLRQGCFCGSSKSNRRTPIRNCGDHARLMASLIRELDALRLAEKRYWATVPQDRRCCGTMDSCPLRQREERRTPPEPATRSTPPVSKDVAAE